MEIKVITQVFESAFFKKKNIFYYYKLKVWKNIIFIELFS